MTVSAGPLSLIDAVKAGDLATARALLAKRADVAATEADGTTALHWAVENDNDALVAVLLAAGAKAQVVNRHGIAPIHRACHQRKRVDRRTGCWPPGRRRTSQRRLARRR